MSVSNLNPKTSDQTNSPVRSLDNKEQDKVCSPNQEVAPSVETLAAIAQHPLADLFGKYNGEIWEEIFDALEQDRLDRQNRQDVTEEDTAASQR